MKVKSPMSINLQVLHWQVMPIASAIHNWAGICLLLWWQGVAVMSVKTNTVVVLIILWEVYNKVYILNKVTQYVQILYVSIRLQWSITTTLNLCILTLHSIIHITVYLSFVCKCRSKISTVWLQHSFWLWATASHVGCFR